MGRRLGNSAHACSDCLALTEFTQLGEQKYLHGEKLAWLGGSLSRTVILPAEPTFCFSRKGCTIFCKEMYGKLTRPW